MTPWKEVLFIEFPPADFLADKRVIEHFATRLREPLPGIFIKVTAAHIKDNLLIVYGGGGFDHSELLNQAIKKTGLTGKVKWAGGNQILDFWNNPHWGKKSFSLGADIPDEVKVIAMEEFKRRYAAYQQGSTPQ